MTFKNDEAPTGRYRTGVFADTLAVENAWHCERKSSAFSDNCAALTRSESGRELIDNRNKQAVVGGNESDVTRQEEVGKLRKVAGKIEIAAYIEGTVARIVGEALWNEARHLAFQRCGDCLTLTVNPDLVQPKVKVAIVLGTGSSVVTKAILEVLAI